MLGPHRRTPAPTARGWRTPTARPEGGLSGEGERLTSDAPHNGERHPSPGTPFRRPHSAQRRPARAHAVGSVLDPHARTSRTRETRVAEPRLPAPEDRRPGEGQRLTPDAPHNGGRPPPPGTAPYHPHDKQPPQGAQAKGTVLGPHTRTPAPTARGWRTPTVRPKGGKSGEGERVTSDAPHDGEQHPSPGDAPPPPPQRATPARRSAHAVGPLLGPHARTHRTRDTRVTEPRLPAPEDGRPGEGQRLTPDPQNGGRPSPRGRPPATPAARSPTGHASQGDSAGPPHPHNRAHSTWVADPDSMPGGGAAGGGGAPDLRCPPQRRQAPTPGDALPQPPQRATQARKGAR